MKRLLLALIVIAVAGLGFAQYKITSSVTEGLENAKRAVAPFVRMEYGDVTTTLTGNIEVTNVRFVSLSDNQEIYAEKIALITGSPWVLFNLRDRIKNNEIPEHLEFAIEGLLADMAFMDNAQKAALTENPLIGLETAGCQGREFFDRSDLKAMGYDHLVLDMKMGYQLSQWGTQLRLTTQVVSRNQVAVDLEMVVEFPSPINEVGPSAELASMSTLTSASIKLEDLGQLNRAMAFCARETGMDPASYREHHLEAWLAAWHEMGLQPSDSLIEAYRDYVNNPGSTLTFDIEPFPALELGSNYLSTDPVYLSGRLNPRVGTDGTGMQPVSLSPIQQGTAGSEKPKTRTPEKPKATPKSTPTADVALKGRISLSSLSQHLHRDVRIIMANGQRMDGRIEAVEGQTLKLKRHMHGGSMVVPVYLQDIEAVTLL